MSTEKSEDALTLLPPNSLVLTADRVVVFADRVLHRLGELGVRLTGGNRITQAARRLSQHLASGCYFAAGTDLRIVSLHLESMRTIVELLIITSAFDSPTEHEAQKLDLMLSGSDEPWSDQRSIGRDTQFEFLIAALLRLGGCASVRMAEPDIVFSIAKNDFAIAAKRVRSRRKVIARANRAFDQIATSMMPGFVALNLDAEADRVSYERGPDAVNQYLTSLVRDLGNRLVPRNERNCLLGVIGLASPFHMLEGRDGFAFGIEANCSLNWLVAPEANTYGATTFSGLGERITTQLKSLLAV